MTCVHCQDTVRNALTEAEGISEAIVSYGAGTAEISYDAETIGEEDIRKIIEALGYRVLSENGKAAERFKTFYPLIVLAVIIALFFVLQYFGLLNYLAPAALANSGMGYGMQFVIGLITSVHCIAMCGGINLSQCVPRDGEKPKGFKAFLPALCYNLGRVLSYTAIGFILGCIGWGIGGGGAVDISPVLQGFLKIIAGILIIVMGVNMLGIIPALRKLNPAMPKFLRRKIGRKKSAATNPFLVGILNGIMPCGPLQSMWVVALATGNPFGGALAMFLFALGTVPFMLGLGSVVAKLGQKFTKSVMTVGSVLVVVLGLAMLSQGGSLTGFRMLSPVVLSAVVIALLFVGVVCSIPIGAKPLKIMMRGTACFLAVAVSFLAIYLNGRGFVNGTYDVSVIEGERQIVTSTLQSGTYPNISVRKDFPVRWVIAADESSINGCNYKILIPEYGIEYVFHTGENVIEFTPEKSGSFDYSCWMGMIYGKIVVENQRGAYVEENR